MKNFITKIIESSKISFDANKIGDESKNPNHFLYHLVKEGEKKGLGSTFETFWHVWVFFATKGFVENIKAVKISKKYSPYSYKRLYESYSYHVDVLVCLALERIMEEDGKLEEAFKDYTIITDLIDNVANGAMLSVKDEVINGDLYSSIDEILIEIKNRASYKELFSESL